MGRRPFSNTRAPNAIVASAAIVAVASLASASGCSFIFSEGAPADHRARESFQCGESSAPPIVDTVAAGLIAAGAAATQGGKDAAVAEAEAEGKNGAQVRHDLDVQIGVGLAFAAIDVASAIYGYRAVGDCREAQAIRFAEVTRARVLTPPYGVPPSGEPPLRWPPPPRAAPPPAPAPPAPAPAEPPATPSP